MSKKWDDIFKGKMDELEFHPSGRVWENLQPEVDAVAVSGAKRRWFSAVAAVLLLVSGVTYFFTHYTVIADIKVVAKNQVPTPTETIKPTTFPSLPPISKTTTPKPPSPSLKKTELPQYTTNSVKKSAKTQKASLFNKISPLTHSKTGVLAQGFSNPVSRTTQYSIFPKSEKVFYKTPPPIKNKSSENIQLVFNYNLDQIIIGDKKINEDLASLDINKMNDVENDEPEFSFIDIPTLQNNKSHTLTGLYLGGVFQFQNSWIIDREKDIDDSRIELTKKAHTGNAYGFALGYDFNNHWGVEFNWIINSEQGQKYKFQYGESIENRNINLSYTHFPLYVKYRNVKRSKLFNKTVAVNYLLGATFSRLKSAEINVNNNLIQTTNILRSQDWGLSVGYDYEIHLDDAYTFVVGGRGTITTGLNAKFETNDHKPSYNALIGINTGLRYRF